MPRRACTPTPRKPLPLQSTFRTGSPPVVRSCLWPQRVTRAGAASLSWPGVVPSGQERTLRGSQRGHTRRVEFPGERCVTVLEIVHRSAGSRECRVLRSSGRVPRRACSGSRAWDAPVSRTCIVALPFCRFACAVSDLASCQGVTRVPSGPAATISGGTASTWAFLADEE